MTLLSQAPTSVVFLVALRLTSQGKPCSFLCWLNVHLSYHIFSGSLILHKPARLCMHCALWAIYIYAFKEETASFLRCWQIIVIYFHSVLRRDCGLWGEAVISLPHSPAQPCIHKHSFTHKGHIPLWSPDAHCLFCCLSTSSVEFLNRICCGERETGAMLAVSCQIALVSFS